MRSLWIIAAVVLLLASAGCAGTSQKADKGSAAESASKNDERALVGSYAFEFTPEIESQLKQNSDALAAAQKLAAAGDQTAQRSLASMSKDATPERRLLEGMKLRLAADKTFTFRLPDRTTGHIRETSGTYAVESGTKLTLTIATIDGKKAEGSDAKALTMTFDAKEQTLTGDTGGGPKSLWKKL